MKALKGKIMSYLAHPKDKKDNTVDRHNKPMIYEIRKMDADSLSQGFQDPHGFRVAEIHLIDDINSLFSAQSLANAFASLLNNGTLSKPIFEKSDDITVHFHQDNEKSATLRTHIKGTGNSTETAKITILAQNIDFSPDVVSRFCQMVNATPKQPKAEPKPPKP